MKLKNDYFPDIEVIHYDSNVYTRIIDIINEHETDYVSNIIRTGGKTIRKYNLYQVFTDFSGSKIYIEVKRTNNVETIHNIVNCKDENFSGKFRLFINQNYIKNE